MCPIAVYGRLRPLITIYTRRKNNSLRNWQQIKFCLFLIGLKDIRLLLTHVCMFIKYVINYSPLGTVSLLMQKQLNYECPEETIFIIGIKIGQMALW